MIKNIFQVKEIKSIGYHIDLYVLNAGISQRDRGLETDFAIDQKIMQINYWSSVYLVKQFKDEILASVDQVMVRLQDLYTADQFDNLYATMQKAVINPLYLTISSVISNCFTGLLIGVLVGFLTRRRPDIFADTNNNANVE